MGLHNEKGWYFGSRFLTEGVRQTLKKMPEIRGGFAAAQTDRGDDTFHGKGNALIGDSQERKLRGSRREQVD